ncbi:MAG TPA: methyltransferase domain-containing protein [Candidatus Acetothermia bacterium]|nr:methyltransferase domain-containing protein [Candidatus Acetothermia bacterium]
MVVPSYPTVPHDGNGRAACHSRSALPWEGIDWERPSWLCLVADGYGGALLFSHSFRRFVDGLGLRGTEAVLEFGAGTGNVTRHLAPRLARGGKLTCIDIFPRLLAVARHGRERTRM